LTTSTPAVGLTDPYEVCSDECGTAAASCFTVDIHTAAVLPVTHDKLHPSVEVLEAGHPCQVHGAQPELLHPHGPPLLQAENITV